MAGTGTPVDVEVVLLRWEAGSLCYRTARRPLGDGERPDDAALALAEIEDGNRRAVCHSTSWRHEDGSVVLTYAVVPDPAPDRPATPLRAPAVVCSGDPLRPAPADLHAHHVVAHAVRHLAYLVDTDPAVAASAQAPQVHSPWPAIKATGAGIPAAVHDTAHRLADRRSAS